MCRYAQFTLSSRQLNYRGFPLIFLNLFFICIGSSLCFFIITQTPSPVVLFDNAFIHYDDAVRHGQCFFLIVRYIDEGQAQTALKVF